MNKDNNQIIKTVTEEVLTMMGFEGEVVVLAAKDDKDTFVCNITTSKDVNLVIGQNGDNLQALQHIVRLLVRKQIEENIKFILDVNSYKKDQETSVIEMAKATAKQVIEERRAIVMRPMSAYNRRLIHMLLADNGDVITESTGDEDERRVVIKPAHM